ncbi:MAG: vWA domain-containing protein [Acidobacteriaceae bacterium]
MKVNRIASSVLFAAIVGMGAGVASPAMAQTENVAGQAHLVVTVNANKSRPLPPLPQSDIAVKLKGRPADIVSWVPLKGPNANLQLVFLIDEGVRSYWALQIPDLKKFIDALPPSTAVAVAYMDNGRAVMAQTLTTDHALAVKALRLTNGIPGISGSPYFCLSDLARNYWRSPASVRRVVFMVTNGEDPYYRSRDMQDPYVAAAIQDAQKAKLLVYSIYFRNQGAGGPNSFSTLIGQSYLQRVADETGGQFYSMAMMSPISFDPFLKQFKQSLERQYLLTFAAGNTGWQQVQVQSKVKGLKLTAPRAIYVEKNP